MDKTIFIQGPDPGLELGYNDVWLLPLFSRRVLVFKLAPSSGHVKAIAALEKALSCLVHGTPELGSESVVVNGSGENGKTPWRALKPYRGIVFIVKDLTTTFPSFTHLERRGFPVAVFKDKLLMPISNHIEPAPQPQAIFQLSLIDGGVLLSVCILHHLTDGNGMNTITHTLRQTCSRLDDETSELAPAALNTDRTIINAVRSTQLDITLHPAYEKISDFFRPESKPVQFLTNDPAHVDKQTLTEPTVAAHEQQQPLPLSPDFAPTYFRLTSSAATRIKASASSSISSASDPPISTHDAIVALLWRTLTRARLALGRLSETDTMTLTLPIDARTRLGLPRDWVGNCVYFCEVQMPVSALAVDGDDDIDLESLRVTAARIRTAINGVDRARVESMLAIRRQDPYSLAMRFVTSASAPTSLMLTSCYHSGLLEQGDWGATLGSVRHFTTTDIGAFGAGFERTAFVGPRFGDGKGCDVMVGVDADELELFHVDPVWKSFFEVKAE